MGICTSKKKKKSQPKNIPKNYKKSPQEKLQQKNKSDEETDNKHQLEILKQNKSLDQNIKNPFTKIKKNEKINSPVKEIEFIPTEKVILSKPILIQFINNLDYRFTGEVIFYKITSKENPKKEQRNLSAYLPSQNSLIDLNQFYFIRHGEGKLRTPPNPSVIEISGHWLNDALQPQFSLNFPLKEKKQEIKASLTGKNPSKISYWLENNEYFEYIGGQYHGIKQGTGNLKLVKKEKKTGEIIVLSEMQGRWMHDCLNGPDCKIVSEDGSIYEGGILLGLKHGHGELKYPNGDFYSGNFIEGIKEGFGILKWGDGYQYEGGWEKGYWKGHGIVTKDGEILKEKKWELREE